MNKKIIVLGFLVLSLFAFSSCNKTQNKETNNQKEIKKEVQLTPEENQILDEIVEPLLNVK